LYWPFYYDRVLGKAPKEAEFLAVETTACPKVTKGYYTYDHGDTARIIPLVKMHPLGHMFVPPPIHAGGLRYHGMAPTLCLLNKEGIIRSRACMHACTFTDKTSEEIKHTLRSLLGDVEIDVVAVDNIRKEKTGKFKLFISKIHA